MNSQRARSESFEKLYNDPYVPTYIYGGQDWKDRLLQPTVLITIATILVTWVLLKSSIRIEALWDALVYVVPYRILYLLDNWLHPPLVPRPMLQGPARTHAAKSALMQRVLGFDRPGGGVMGTVSQAGQRGLASFSGAMMALKGGSSDRPAGLGNLDNSCYQNSILQGLASLRPLPRYLSDQLRHIPLDAANQKTYQAALSLGTLIADLNDASNHGKTLWTPGSLKNMSTWQQQDAQEYYSKLLDEIDREIAKAAKVRNSSLPCLELKAAAAAEATEDANAAADDDTNESQHSDDSGYQSISVVSRTADSSSAPKASHNPLEGLVAQRVACVQCGHCDGLSMIPFNCLTLSLGLNSAEHDLFELLDAYAHIESIEGVECGKCTLLKMKRLLTTILDRERASSSSSSSSSRGAKGDESEKMGRHGARLAAVEEALEHDDFDDGTITGVCQVPPNLKVTSTKTKQAVIARPPQSLVIHMNRSAFDENTGYMWKNSAAVRFPLVLDLGPWCLGSAGTFERVQGQGQGGSTVPMVVPAHPDREEWLLRPRVSMVAGDKGQSKITGPLYELRAVITHYGRHENGHYVCYRKFPKSAAPEATKPLEPAESERRNENDGDVAAEQESSAEVQIPDTDAGTEEVAGPEQSYKNNDDDDDASSETEMEWWRLSDETVYKVDEETVLAQGGVFMLFYDCVDPVSVLTAQVEDDAEASAEMMPPGEDATRTPSLTERIDGRKEMSTPLPPAKHDVSSYGGGGSIPTPPASDAEGGVESATTGDEPIVSPQEAKAV